MAKTFLYNAQGCVLGGFFTRPFQDVLDNLADVSLATTGGKGKKSANSYKYKDIISIDSASTEVKGNQDGGNGSYNTQVTITIAGFKFQNTISADQMVATIVTRNSGNEKETHVVPSCQYVNLRVAGELVQIDPDDTLGQADTFADYKVRYGNSSNQSNAGTTIRCSVNKNIGHSLVTTTDGQQVIVVPDFGKIYLGEVYVKEGTRQLTMMRLELGSPLAGSLTLGGGQGNGTAFP